MKDIWPRSSVLNLDSQVGVAATNSVNDLHNRANSRQMGVQNLGGNPIPPDASDLSFEEPEQSINQFSQLAAEHASTNLIRLQELTA